MTNGGAEGTDDGVDAEQLVMLVEMVEVDDVRLELGRAHVRREGPPRRDDDAAEVRIGEEQTKALAADETCRAGEQDRPGGISGRHGSGNQSHDHDPSPIRSCKAALRRRVAQRARFSCASSSTWT